MIKQKSGPEKTLFHNVLSFVVQSAEVLALFSNMYHLYIKKYRPDMVILDIMMPKRDGISALREMRMRGCNIPVLILSAKSEDADEQSSLSGPQHAFLLPGCDFQEYKCHADATASP